MEEKKEQYESHLNQNTVLEEIMGKISFNKIMMGSNNSKLQKYFDWRRIIS